MGQLEKYGLYVLCLVTFLIFGVAIWGEPASAADDRARGGAGAALENRAPVADLRELTAPMEHPAPRRNEGAEAAVPDPASGNAVDGNPLSGTPLSGNPGDGSPVDGGPADAPRHEPPAPQPAPQPVERPTYTIRPGDTLSEIAQHRVGSIRFVPLVLKLNPGVDANRLQPGTVLKLPTAAELEQAGAGRGGRAAAGEPGAGTPGSAVPRTHEIKGGDTLEALAKRYYGDARRVPDILAANPGIDPARLRLGSRIRLPAK